MEPSAGWERTKRIVDLIAGLSVIATMVFIALQWNAMRTGAADTHDLAIAAKSQADNTAKLALAAVNQVDKLAAGVKESHAIARTAQANLSETRNNFARDQRPYMWPKLDPPMFQKGAPVRWNINFINYGRSPAIHVYTCVILSLGVDAMEAVTEEKMVEHCKKSPLPTSESIVPPGDSVFATAQSGGILADDNGIAFFRDFDFRVVMKATIVYEDGAGNHYKSTFCSAHLATGAAYTCQKGNEIK